jgi:glutamyl-tRNA synthetase
MRGILAGVGDWSQTSIEAVTTAYCNEHAGAKIGSVAQPLRIGVAGSTVSPPIWDTLVLVGKASALARIDRCIAWAQAL